MMTDERLYGGSMVGMLLGLVAVLWGLWALLVTLPTMLFWEETPGVVTSYHTFSENLIDPTSRYTSGSKRYYICLRYSYEASDTTRSGWRINPGYEDHFDKPGSPCQSTKEAEENAQIRSDYRRGARVWVLFDPSDPKDSVLENGLRFFDLLALIGGAILFGGAFFLHRHIRRYM